MTARETFRQVMRGSAGVGSLKWEYAYWGATLNRWYQEGLPRKQFVQTRSRSSTPTSSLYLAAYNRNRDKVEAGILPDGLAVFGGGVYWPTQGLPKDRDVELYFGLDEGVELADVNQLFSPLFDVEVLHEDDETFRYIDIDGITRIYQKKESTLPTAIDWIVKDEKTWARVKEERLSMGSLSERFPADWQDQISRYNGRTFPLALGGYPHGLFGTPSHIMGYENLFCGYYDNPRLIHDIASTFTELWIAVWSEVLAKVEVDMVHIFEDVSMGTGSMISPAVFREFMLPYYRRLCDFLKSEGVEIILVDTDGDCSDLIPLFLEGGVTGLYPMEVLGGLDIRKVRKDFPLLQMMGGVSKRSLSGTESDIEEELRKVEDVLKHGRYIPFVDHSVPPSVSWQSFRSYRSKLNRLVERGRPAEA
jgi:uroporphyrinogen decarboxylase